MKKKKKQQYKKPATKRKASVRKNTVRKKSTVKNRPSKLGASDKRILTLGSLIILIVTIVLYANTLSLEYALDDKIGITKNRFTKQGVSGIGDILTHDSFTTYFGKEQELVAGGRYRPLSIITFAIEWQLVADSARLNLDDKAYQNLQKKGVPVAVLKGLKTIENKNFDGKKQLKEAIISAIGNNSYTTYKAHILDYLELPDGSNPALSHGVNMVLYAFAGILIFIVFYRMLFDRFSLHEKRKQWFLSIPFIAALLFVAHPVHTEVVANIKSRDEIMMLIFSLVTLWLSYLHFTNRLKIHRILAWLLISVSFFLSLLSKENAVTFVVLIPLSLYFFSSAKAKKYLLSAVPLFVVTVVFLIIRFNILNRFLGKPLPELMNDPFLYATTGEKFATIFYTLVLYLKLLVFPHPLTYDYYPFHIPLINWGDLRAWLGLILYVGMGVYALFTMKKKTLISYGIWFYLISLSLFTNIVFSVGTFMGERFLFVASIGFCLIIGYLTGEKMPQLFKRKLPYRASAVALVLLIVVLFGIKTIQRNPVWKNDYSLFTTDVHTSSGSAYGNLTAGKRYYFRGKKLPGGAKRDSMLQKAVFYLTNAVEIHPKYVNGLFYLSESHYEKDKDWGKAIKYLEQLSTLTPGEAEVMYRLGALYGKYLQNYDKAIYYLNRTIEINPRHLMALDNLGAIYYNRKQYEEALEVFKKLSKVKPNDPKVYRNISIAYRSLGNVQKAEEYKQKAMELSKRKQ